MIPATVYLMKIPLLSKRIVYQYVPENGNSEKHRMCNQEQNKERIE